MAKIEAITEHVVSVGFSLPQPPGGNVDYKCKSCLLLVHRTPDERRSVEIKLLADGSDTAAEISICDIPDIVTALQAMYQHCSAGGKEPIETEVR